jgi:hypothetical protein
VTVGAIPPHHAGVMVRVVSFLPRRVRLDLRVALNGWLRPDDVAGVVQEAVVSQARVA